MSQTTDAPSLPTDPRYVQRDRREILQVLRRMIAEETPVLVTYGGEGDALHTKLLDLSDDQRSLFLEWGPDDDVSARVLECETIACQAEIDRVRLHFALEPKAGRLRYLKAFTARVPDLVFRVQRREYYRLPIEPDDGVGCRIDLPHPGGRVRPTGVDLIDLSGGGLAFRVPLALGAQLRMHVELPGCVLTLPDGVELDTRVRVRDLVKVVDDEGVAWVRVGAQFLDLRVGHIAQVQRLIGAIERRRRDDERKRAELEARRAAYESAMRRDTGAGR